MTEAETSEQWYFGEYLKAMRRKNQGASSCQEKERPQGEENQGGGQWKFGRKIEGRIGSGVAAGTELLGIIACYPFATAKSAHSKGRWVR